jgi:hypothetical protein
VCSAHMQVMRYVTTAAGGAGSLSCVDNPPTDNSPQPVPCASRKLGTNVQNVAGSQEVSYLYGSAVRRRQGPVAWDRVTPACSTLRGVEEAERGMAAGKDFGNLTTPPLRVLDQNTSRTQIHKQCQHGLF